MCRIHIYCASLTWVFFSQIGAHCACIFWNLKIAYVAYTCNDYFLPNFGNQNTKAILLKYLLLLFCSYLKRENAPFKPKWNSKDPSESRTGIGASCVVMQSADHLRRAGCLTEGPRWNERRAGIRRHKRPSNQQWGGLKWLRAIIEERDAPTRPIFRRSSRRDSVRAESLAGWWMDEYGGRPPPHVGAAVVVENYLRRRNTECVRSFAEGLSRCRLRRPPFVSDRPTLDLLKLLSGEGLKVCAKRDVWINSLRASEVFAAVGNNAGVTLMC
jgi:hypothetical protein